MKLIIQISHRKNNVINIDIVQNTTGITGILKSPNIDAALIGLAHHLNEHAATQIDVSDFDGDPDLAKHYIGTKLSTLLAQRIPDSYRHDRFDIGLAYDFEKDTVEYVWSSWRKVDEITHRQYLAKILNITNINIAKFRLDFVPALYLLLESKPIPNVPTSVTPPGKYSKKYGHQTLGDFVLIEKTEYALKMYIIPILVSVVGAVITMIIMSKVL